jgi:hypothetical protein
MGKGDYMNFKGLIVLGLAALLLGACADPDNDMFRSRNSMINLANTCATCGAAVGDNYFADSAFRAVGPGSY